MTLTYLSVCSGIEAASVAWHTLGWRPVAFSEIEPFACAMLAARFPLVPNLGDMERYREWPIEPGAIDVLVGGTPCQSFSVAGLRKGLDDPRGNLALVYLGLVDRFRPRWIVWENVPGVLSADGGRAFGAFLGGLAQLGYGFAYRVLDAQWCRVDSHPRAVPQRRRRVFVVGCAGGDARRAASVLLEPDGVRGDPPTRRASWEGTPRGPAAGARDGGIADVSPTVVAKWHKGTGGPAGDEAQNLVPASYGIRSDAVREGIARTPSADAEGRVRLRDPGLGIYDQLSPTLDTVSPHIVAHPEVAATLGRRGTRSHTELDGHGAHIVEPLPFDTTQITHPADRSQPQPGDPCHPLARGAHAPAVAVPAVFTLEVRGREGERVLEYRTDGTANALRTPNGGRDGLGVGAVAYGINSDAIDRSGEHKTGSAAARSGLGITCEVQPTLKARPTNSVAITPAVAFKASHFTRGKDGAPAAVVPPLSADADKGDQDTLVATPPMAVRRLTPRECERLQGFPDDWTLINYRGKPASDGPRYKALGNSMAVNVMRWIGLRIAAVEGGTHEVR